MSEQAALFYDDELDAIRAAIHALGGSKSVAARLWPAKEPDKARNYLNDCLNADRPHHLEFPEILRIAGWAREAGFHGLKHYIDDATGYERGKPVEPESELARLQRAYIDAVRMLSILTPKIEEARSRLQVAK